MKESDAELLLRSGIILKEAAKCGCDTCIDFVLSVDTDFYKVATRFAALKKTNPGLLFQVLLEEWNREVILQNIPELYK